MAQSKNRLEIPGMTRDLHMILARELFRAAWELLSQEELFAAEEDELLQMAHASRYHWEVAGTAQNRAIAEYLLSRVYIRCCRPEPAIYHGRRALQISLHEPHVPDFCTSYAYIALAHAYNLSGDPLAEENLRMAREMADSVEDDEMRAGILRELQELDPDVS